jgi:hypothetical protein
MTFEVFPGLPPRAGETSEVFLLAVGNELFKSLQRVGAVDPDA